MEPAGRKQRFFRYILLTFFVLMVLEFSLNIFGFASFKFNSSLWRQLNQSRQLIDEITIGVQNLESLVNEIHPQAKSANSYSLPGTSEQKHSLQSHPQSASQPYKPYPVQSQPPRQSQPLPPGKKSLLNVHNTTLSPTTQTPTTPFMGSTELQLCPDPTPKLVGMLRVSKVPMQLLAVEKLHSSDMLAGGLFKPAGCVARHRVAIIIPFRDREEHLHIFLNHLLPILKRQSLEFRIYLVDLIPGVHFNRAMLMNVGFAESIKVSLMK